MLESFKDIPTPDGRMNTFITHPEQGGPFPAVVIYMDIWGMREELYDIARRVASVGYYCMVPNLYHRQGDISFNYRDTQGRAMSLRRLAEAEQKKVLAPLEKLTNSMAIEDTGAMLKFLRDQPAAKPGPKGCVGYCMGGRFVLCAAGVYPDDFRAAASLHGTALISKMPDSPHEMVHKFKGEVYGGFAERDPYAPPEMIAELDALLAKHKVPHHFEIHRDTDHGYALPHRDIYARAAAERDWELIFAMFRRQIPAYA
ncbi:MAG: dienelactone hydrolase family protein [Candidatus Lambdaproteobacteria bacterium]|nr:dienelactone hydrolase family protein [Candidatus Lambdaproteobacteria bacterium]